MSKHIYRVAAMKLLTFRLTAALLATVLGVGTLAIAADEAPETKSQEEAAPAPVETAKKPVSKKPRGLLVDSFFWPTGPEKGGPNNSLAAAHHANLPGVAGKGESPVVERLPIAEPVIVTPVVTAAVATDPARIAPPRVEPVLNIPAPPVVEAPSPLAQPAPAAYYQAGPAAPVQPPAGPYYQTTAFPAGLAPQVHPASWSTYAGPEAQMQASPAPISSNVAYSCSDDDSCTSCGCCPDPLWCHRSGVFLDLLYLRPGNIDYVYAVEQTGPLATDVPTGHTGRVGFDGSPGYRLGGTFAMSDCSSIQVGYTWYNTDTGSSITANPGTVLIFQPGLPQIPNVGATSIAASASQALRYQLLELDYRGLLYGTCDSAINYFGGLRYANLKQTFQAQEDIGVPVGLSTVNTQINFDGFGIGMGLDAMKRRADTGLLIYGRSSASFVSGEFKAQYRQVSQFGPNSIIGNNITDYRVMSILQTELGVGWRSACGRIQILGGYQFQSWGNALTTASYIPGVQNRRFDNLNENLTFDGFTSRLQLQW